MYIYKTDLKTELSFLTQFGNFKFHVVYKDFRFAFKKKQLFGVFNLNCKLTLRLI